MIYQGEHFSLDTRSYTITRDANKLSVEPQVFDLLVYLIENRERVVTRDELLENLWPGRVVSDSALNGRLKLARKSIGDDGKQQKIIRTIHRRGYRIVADIEELADADGLDKTTDSIQSRPQGKPSLAVPGFANLSKDAAQVYFSEGVAMNIVSGLGRTNRIVVKSALSCDLTQVSAAATASELEVDYLLSGAVQREGERVRIFVELLAAASGESVWCRSRFAGTTDHWKKIPGRRVKPAGDHALLGAGACAPGGTSIAGDKGSQLRGAFFLIVFAFFTGG